MSESLQIENLREGSGTQAAAGNTVTVHYVGTLTNGSKFDSSRDRGQGFTFKLGAGQVIAGWDQGVAGMRVGEVRKLTIPPQLAYGERGFPPVIPPQSTLVFEVELLAVR
ncbi:MAG TPA: FKBP-type peptidyl-prolyl cis-trans isomerase [Polyangiaceae bacterium]